MHPSAAENFRKFIEKYINNSKQKEFIFLEIGSYNVNGSLKDILDSHCQKSFNHIGMDIEAGPGVDKVIEPYNFPYENYADVVLSNSQLEHDPQFWRTIEQMKKAAKPNGLIWLCAPSKGSVHRYPVDVYRFYPDAFPELAKAYGMTCLESYIDETAHDWGDNVAVLKK